MTTTTRSDVRVSPVTREIGAIVERVDLRDPLDDQVIALLRAAVLRHRVVFLPEPASRLGGPPDAGGALWSARGLAAARPARDGADSLDNRGRRAAASGVLRLAHRPQLDAGSARVRLPRGARDPAVRRRHHLGEPRRSVRRAVAAAPDRVRGCARGARTRGDFAPSVERNHGSQIAIALRRAFPGVTHPLVRRHPETDEALLSLSPLYMTRIVGLQRTHGERMLARERLLENPLIQVRWRWQAGDVAIWDEAATCHRALGDHFPQRRAMRRCVVEGNVPLPARANAQSRPSTDLFARELLDTRQTECNGNSVRTVTPRSLAFTVRVPPTAAARPRIDRNPMPSPASAPKPRPSSATSTVRWEPLAVVPTRTRAPRPRL